MKKLQEVLINGEWVNIESDNFEIILNTPEVLILNDRRGTRAVTTPPPYDKEQDHKVR